mmetsp:Transcript_62732/g.119107  ORF Transcript_62732/g.119107 Transcript_62732/m.119107 type:complete len:297 (-) Transcript_62732:203-1093(-)
MHLQHRQHPGSLGHHTTEEEQQLPVHQGLLWGSLRGDCRARPQTHIVPQARQQDHLQRHLLFLLACEHQARRGCTEQRERRLALLLPRPRPGITELRQARRRVLRQPRLPWATVQQAHQLDHRQPRRLQACTALQAQGRLPLALGSPARQRALHQRRPLPAIGQLLARQRGPRRGRLLWAIEQQAHQRDLRRPRHRQGTMVRRQARQPPCPALTVLQARQVVHHQPHHPQATTGQLRARRLARHLPHQVSEQLARHRGIGQQAHQQGHRLPHLRQVFIAEQPRRLDLLLQHRALDV